MWSMRGLRGVAIGCMAAVLFSLPPSARAQTCLKDHHEVKYPGGSAKLRDYLCKIGKGADAKRIRVTFHRLSEVMAGNLIMGEPLPELDAIVGKAEVVRNEVYTEVETIFKKFGDSEKNDNPEWSPVWPVKVETPQVSGPGTGSKVVVAPSYLPKRWYLTRPDLAPDGHAIFLSSTNDIIFNTESWPEGWNANYACAGGSADFISCTVLWRTLPVSSLDEVERDTAQWMKRIGRVGASETPESAESAEEPANADSDAADDPIIPDYQRHFPLFRHLSKRDLPDDFIIVTGDNHACGGEFNFTYYPRPLVLDIVVIENVSKAAITIDDLSGSRSADESVRAHSKTEDLRQQAPSGLDLELETLEPGAKLAVPLRIMFADGARRRSDGEVVVNNFPNPDLSKKVFARIQALPPGSIISERFGDNKDVLVKKTRESFPPSTQPAFTQYVYGPEIAVSGLVVDGIPMQLEGTSANYVEITVAPDGLSCPILYAWQAGSWDRLGKVIDTARERVRETTQVVPVRAGTTRFRLAEEEPEVSYIDQVELRLKLADGRQLVLAPDQSELGARDQRYLRILAYRSEVIDFALPPDVAADRIETSELAITGYYRRYSTIGSELAARSRARPVVPVGLDAAELGAGAAGESRDKNR